MLSGESNAMTNIHELTHELVQERLTTAIRCCAGFGQKYSVAEVAELTGIPERTIKSYHQGQACPGTPALLKLMLVLGPEFAGMLTELADMTVTHHGDDRVCSLSLNAHAAGLTALIARHMVDGFIDHREEAIQEPVVRELVQKANAWLIRRRDEREAA
jgi:hypothetical protein